MKTFILCFVTLAASTLFGSTIYQNNTTDLANSVQYNANSYSALGDQITLGGTDRFATQASTQFFNFDSTATTFDATLRLYAVGSGGSVVGALLGTYTAAGISITGFDANNAGSGLANVTFTGLNTVVPNSVIFVLSVANISTQTADLGIELYEPPTIGSSDNSTYISATGGTFASSFTDPGYGNLNFALTATAGAAVPEPATWAAIGGGLAVLAFARRTKA
jgi:hypothetical protein